MVSVAPDLELRRSAGERWGMALLPLIPATMVLVMAGFGVLLTPFVPVMGVILLLTGVGMAALTAVVVREARARWITRVRILGMGQIELRLPARRGYAKLPPLETTLPFTRVRAVYSRVEAYRALGMAALQTAWWLELDDGSHIYLGADRPNVPFFFSHVGEAIAARTGAPVEQLGMVDGDGGVAMLGGVKAPDWNAPALAPAAEASRRRGAALAYKLMGVAVALVILARLIALFF